MLVSWTSFKKLSGPLILGTYILDLGTYMKHHEAAFLLCTEYLGLQTLESNCIRSLLSQALEARNHSFISPAHVLPPISRSQEIWHFKMKCISEEFEMAILTILKPLKHIPEVTPGFHMFSSSWFQPIWDISVKLDSFRPGCVSAAACLTSWKSKCLKPPLHLAHPKFNMEPDNKSIIISKLNTFSDFPGTYFSCEPF